MASSGKPKDGDFVAHLQELASQVKTARDQGSGTYWEERIAQAESVPMHKQTLEDVIVQGEAPTDEFLAEFAELENAEPISDEELERQALEHPGGDGDPATPE